MRNKNQARKTLQSNTRPLAGITAGFLSEVRVSKYADGLTAIHITVNGFEEEQWWRSIIKPLPRVDITFDRIDLSTMNDSLDLT